jgi:hypothetical protein
MLNVAWGGWLGEAPAVTLKRDMAWIAATTIAKLTIDREI